jgi:type II secretory pathway predicted ATPase ExeA
MMNISLSARALVAARAVDPQVSTAAVRAAVEAALAEQLRELRRRQEFADDAEPLSTESLSTER